MTGPTRTQRMRVGHVWMDAVSFAVALDRIQALVEGGAGGRVFTPNVDHVVMADRDLAFRTAYASADLSLVDGQVLLWAARLLDTPLPEKVSGSDLILPLMERAGQRGWRVYLLGGGPGAAEQAAVVVKERYGVNVVGVASPRIERDPAPGSEDPIVSAITAVQTQLLLVALGAPKQELFLDRNRVRLGPAVGVGVGASVDFVAGRVQRAPPWISQAGLEWLYRLGREPRRLWKRYLIDDARFAPILMRTGREPRSSRVQD